MAKGFIVKVAPSVLKWARESGGYDIAQVSEKTKISQERLEQWESGVEGPTISQLRRLGDLYKRPLAVFCLSEPPDEYKVESLKDYRKLYGSKESRYSPELLFEIRKSRYRRDSAIEVSKLLGSEIKPFDISISIDNDPEETSNYIRNMLNVSVNEQCNWANSYEALNRWRSAIESMYVLVFQTNSHSHIDVKEMRGFSMSEEIFPVILLNSKDAVNARIFTLAHELIHLLLHSGGICDITDDEADRVELFCNHVAGAILVPKRDLLGHDLVVKNNDIEWQDFTIEKLSSYFSVSKEVILRRLLILEKTSNEFYKLKREEYIRD